MNIAATIVPKSDQLNADDLIAGPRTLTITGVKQGNSPEQPVNIEYEGGTGRPWKPCKSMRRVLVALWGEDASAYVGRRVTLFRDPEVTFGKDATGGIRISHMSGIDGPKSIALTVTRGKRKPYTVQPLPTEAPAPDLAALEDIGVSKASEGIDALTAWAATLTKAQKCAIGLERFNQWKATAAEVK